LLGGDSFLADRVEGQIAGNGLNRIRAVRHFADWLGRSPDKASAEDLRRYQLHCMERGVSPVTLNATITGPGPEHRRTVQTRTLTQLKGGQMKDVSSDFQAESVHGVRQRQE
jgi:hypothetical protein